MSTASTKSRPGKKAGDARSSATVSGGEAGREASSAWPDILAPVWRGAGIVILLVAALLRFSALEINPLHHDEGVNGFFLLNLLREGVYHYDPANYHGPTLYYITLPVAALASHLGVLNTFVIRAVPALFGIATVGLALALRRYIGSIGALSAAALIAVSPGAVYISRYFIHESLFVFFTLGAVVAALRYTEEKRPPNLPQNMGVASALSAAVLVAISLGAVYDPRYLTYEAPLLLLALAATVVALWYYDGERSVYLVLCTASVALLFATKETAFISAGVLILATVLAWGYMRLMKQPAQPVAGKKARSAGKSAGADVVPDATMTRFAGPAHTGLLLLIAGGLFVFINVLFYSSFFTYSEGVHGALKTFAIWEKTGANQHTKPWDTYLKWLLQEEGPIFVLGMVGSVWAVLSRKNRFAIFSALWATGIIAAYSRIDYKTPWLALNFIVPLAIIGGYSVQRIYEWSGRAAPALVLVSIAIIICLGQTITLNFIHYDDDRYPYVYAHTRREYLQLISEINTVAAHAGTGTDTTISIASPEYWPMPWYLRDYKRVGYPGVVQPSNDAIVVASEAQAIQAEALLGDHYQRIGTYALRPGVNLVLYVRRDLAGR